MAIIRIKDKAINLNHFRYCEVGYTLDTDNKTKDWFVFVNFDIGGCKIMCANVEETKTILDFIIGMSK